MISRVIFSVLVTLFATLAHATTSLSDDEVRTRSQILELANARLDIEMPQFLMGVGLRYLIGTALIENLTPFDATTLECELNLLGSFEMKLDALLEKANAQEQNGRARLLELLLDDGSYRNLKYPAR